MVNLAITAIKRLETGWQGYEPRLDAWLPLPWTAEASANKVCADLVKRGVVPQDYFVTVWE